MAFRGVVRRCFKSQAHSTLKALMETLWIFGFCRNGPLVLLSPMK
jgi:hypothetical protein